MGLRRLEIACSLGLILLFRPLVVEGISSLRLRALLSEERQFEARMSRSGIADEAGGYAFERQSVAKLGSRGNAAKVQDLGPEALTCIAHTGLVCTNYSQMHEDGSEHFFDRCSALTSGPSTCIQSRCECEEGFCSDSYGQCSAVRSELLPQIFRINPEAHPNSFLAMGTTPGGQVVLQVTAEDGNTTHTQWRVVRRTDGTQLLTTMAYPNHVVRFVKECEAVDMQGEVQCHYRVEVAQMWEASSIGTEIKKYGMSGKLILVDIHTSVVLYFDLKQYTYGLGCYLYGHDCPHETSFLHFVPPLPDAVMYDLYAVDPVSRWVIISYVLGAIFSILLIALCWKECCLNVKGTRFASGGTLTLSGS